MCVYGYCRISTKQQSIERQIRNIKAEYDKAVIITEAYSGTTMNRPEWNKLYKKALQNNVSLTSTNVDYILEGVNKYLMALAKEQIKLAFEQSEKEVEDLHQRTKEGIAAARLNGKQIGQKQGAKLITKKSIEAKKQIQKHIKDFDGTLSDVDCMKLTGLARNTYYKYKREMKAE